MSNIYIHLKEEDSFPIGCVSSFLEKWKTVSTGIQKNRASKVLRKRLDRFGELLGELKEMEDLYALITLR
jgi:hypothetical protein